jgi:hypothetical protein
MNNPNRNNENNKNKTIKTNVNKPKSPQEIVNNDKKRNHSSSSNFE